MWRAPGGTRHSRIARRLISGASPCGHEWSGVVAERGPGADRFAVGDRVVGDTGIACGSCTECLLGRWPRCRRAQAVGTVNAWDGAFAGYILMPERHVYALPGGVSLENGALLSLASGKFSIFLTVDKHIERTQQLPANLAVVTLRARTNRIESLRPLVP